MDIIKSLVAEKPVVIFCTSSCCISHSIQTLISGFGAKTTVYELDRFPDGQDMEKALAHMGCKPSLPAVFIGQQLIGSTDQVMSLQLKNQLAPLLRQAGAIWV